MWLARGKTESIANGARHAITFSVRRLLLWHHVLIPSLLLCALYAKAYHIWDSRTGGKHRWDSTWPKGRTRLVLLMFVLPVWGSLMVATTLLYVGIRRAWSGRRLRLSLREQSSYPAELAPLNDSQSDNNDATGDFAEKHINVRGGVRRWWAQPSSKAIAFYVVLAMFGVFLNATYEQKADIRFRPLLQKALSHPKPEGYHTQEKYFICANFYENEDILPRWTQEMVKVIQYLGTSNVFVSIYENNSEDYTPALLRRFDKQLEELGVERLIRTNDSSIPPPDTRQTGKTRIAFLAAVRNEVLKPLYERGGFDRILFLNDIYFEAESVIELLRTYDGDWDQVCGLDFSYWGFYDAWVTRDRLGALVSSVWPYLMEDDGMNAIVDGAPAPVFSCWNGITALRSDPFLSPEQRNRSSTVLSKDKLWPWLPWGHPQYDKYAETPPADMPALRFRTSQEGWECFSSECFLISYDFHRQFALHKVYINPNVIVAYDWDFYVWYKWVIRHWLVKWWIENVESGASYMKTRVTMGYKSNVWSWDGIHCFPFN
ncbi:cryptococcal mannosyltransferase 1-domain-containing protein [Auriculariales sp. MPI-PUGE-AT-0066]|nr:cryptococcal mannosyltransferase 1-domain-containing protein [Auriculariales sp. MPI-PUGE-AT-0066]